MTFSAPIKDISFTLKHIAGLDSLLERRLFEDLEEDLVDAILEEAGKFAAEKLAPINRAGDEQGAELIDGKVVMPDGWAEAYQAWIEGAWGSLTGPKEYGGQGLPTMIAMACAELWNSSSMAFALNPLLTQASVNALNLYGNDQLKEKYLPKLITGEWTGSMQLTEPHAGSDLSLMKSKAIPQGDGSYRLTGTKIFITYGEHPLTDNIVHMVLARTPDGPPGTKGISLFLVPKYLVNDDGSIGDRNDVTCAKVEHKLGIHASPTCVLNYGDKDGAVGWLIGEEFKGLYAMLTMMNEARLGVGIQGVAIAGRAFQHALAYAQERKQGQTKTTPTGDMAPIIEHPDVRRMLLGMKAKTAAARAICYMTANAIDLSTHASDKAERTAAHALASLLTPVAKAYSTDIGVEVASEGVQIHGGMGYIEETGAAQFYRDARIAPIYEGTNGIQAIDLVTRKLPLNGGDVVRAHIAGLKETVDQVKAANTPSFGQMGNRLEEAVDAFTEASEWILRTLPENRDAVLASATAYGRLFGIVTGATYLARGALTAIRGGNEANSDQIALARHFAENLLGEAIGLNQSVTRGSDAILAPSQNVLTE